MNYLYKYIIFTIVVLFLFSCGNSFLSRREMVDVLYDIHMAESTIQVVANSSSRIEKQEYFNKIFEKHGITKDEFDEAVAWYSNNPKEYNQFYVELIERATEFKGQVDDFEFHPELSPQHSDSVQSMDLWYWRDKIVYQDSISFDSLCFEFKDSTYFAHSDTLRWKFRIIMHSAVDKDSSNIVMLLNYDNLKVDTISYFLPIDSVKRAVTFTKLLPDTIRLASVDFSFADNLDSVSYIEVDSISFLRIFNKFSFPMAIEKSKEIDRLRDSVVYGKIEEKKKIAVNRQFHQLRERDE